MSADAAAATASLNQAVPAAAGEFLTVEFAPTRPRSPIGASRKRWTIAAPPPELEALAQAASLPIAIAALLHARGIRTPQEAELFLSPSVRRA